MMSRVHVDRAASPRFSVFANPVMRTLFGAPRSPGKNHRRTPLSRGTSMSSYFSGGRDNVSDADFEPIRLIGEGEFSDVFLVRKLTGVDEGKLYAMKKVKASRHFSRDEVAAMRLGASPFVVACRYSYGLTIVMDHASRGTVEEALAKRTNRRFKPAVVLAVAAEVAQALGYLHTVGVVHRDVKPANLLVDGAGHVLLGDFGLSALCDTSKRTPLGLFCGTVAYCAPEILGKGARYGAAVDWWSFGCVLCELMLGSAPFASATPRDLFENILHHPPKWHTIQAKPVDMSNVDAQDFRTLLEGLLAKGAEDRFAFDDVVNHPVFANTDWSAVRRRRHPPFPPADATASAAQKDCNKGRVRRSFSFSSKQQGKNTPNNQSVKLDHAFAPSLRTRAGAPTATSEEKTRAARNDDDKAARTERPIKASRRAAKGLLPATPRNLDDDILSVIADDALASAMDGMIPRRRRIHHRRHEPTPPSASYEDEVADKFVSGRISILPPKVLAGKANAATPTTTRRRPVAPLASPDQPIYTSSNKKKKTKPPRSRPSTGDDDDPLMTMKEPAMGRNLRALKATRLLAAAQQPASLSSSKQHRRNHITNGRASPPVIPAGNFYPDAATSPDHAAAPSEVPRVTPDHASRAVDEPPAGHAALPKKPRRDAHRGAVPATPVSI